MNPEMVSGWGSSCPDAIDVGYELPTGGGRRSLPPAQPGQFRYGANFEIVGKATPERVSGRGAWRPVAGNFTDLAAHIAKGHPWMPAILDGGATRAQRASNYAEVLGADIDGGMAIADAMAYPFIAAHCGLGIESASSSPALPKFRLVFRLPRAIEAWETLRTCNRYLIHLLGVADAACKDASRFFFGAPGRTAFLLNETATLPPSFIEDAIAWAAEQDAARRSEQIEWEGTADEATILDALAAIPPRVPGTGTRDRYCSMLWGLCNALGEDRAIALMQQHSPDWDAREIEKNARWAARSSATLGSVFHFAREHGWQGSTGAKPKDGKPIDPHAIALKRARYALENSLRGGDLVLEAQLLPRDFWQGVEGDLAISSGLGTGKSEAIGDLIAQLPRHASVVALTHRVALGGNLAERWGLDLLNHLDRAAGKTFNTVTGRMSDGRRVAACLDSVHLTPNAPDVLILDEVSKELRHILTGGTCKKKRPKLLAAFVRRVREATRVIIADADLTDLEIAFIEAIRGQRMTLIRNEYRAPLPVTLLQCPDDSAAIAKVLELVQAGQRVMVLCSQKSTAIAIDTLLADTLSPAERFLIHGDNSGDEERRLFLADPNPYLQRARLKALIASPTIAEGLSITGNFFDAVVGVFHATSIDDASICQFMRRYRREVPRWMWVESGRGGKPFTAKELLQTERAIASVTLKGTGFDAQVLLLDWESTAQKLAYQYRAQREWAIANLRAATQTRLEWQGCTVTTLEAKTVGWMRESLREIAKAKKHAYCEGVATANPVTEFEAAAIERRIQLGKATKADRLALARYKLEEFYKTPATPELVAEDGNGKLREAIARLEELSLPDQAVELDRVKLKKLAADGGEILGGDLPTRHARAIVTQLLGLDTLLVDLFAGGTYTAEDERVRSIFALATAPATTTRPGSAPLIRALFGFTPRATMGPCEVIGRFLKAFGLKAKRTQQRTKKGRFSVYGLDFERSATTIATVGRRYESLVRQGVSPQHTSLFDLLWATWCDQLQASDDRSQIMPVEGSDRPHRPPGSGSFASATEGI